MIEDRNLEFRSFGDLPDMMTNEWYSSVAIFDHEEQIIWEVQSRKGYPFPGNYDDAATELCDKIEARDIRCSKPPSPREMNVGIAL